MKYGDLHKDKNKEMNQDIESVGTNTSGIEIKSGA